MTNRISIHAPRAGRDEVIDVVETASLPISIHAPRAGRDQAPQYGQAYQ